MSCFWPSHSSSSQSRQVSDGIGITGEEGVVRQLAVCDAETTCLYIAFPRGDLLGRVLHGGGSGRAWGDPPIYPQPLIDDAALAVVLAVELATLPRGRSGSPRFRTKPAAGRLDHRDPQSPEYGCSGKWRGTRPRCSPLPMSTGWAVYSSPVSSSIICGFQPLGVGAV